MPTEVSADECCRRAGRSRRGASVATKGESDTQLVAVRAGARLLSRRVGQEPGQRKHRERSRLVTRNSQLRAMPCHLSCFTARHRWDFHTNDSTFVAGFQVSCFSLALCKSATIIMASGLVSMQFTEEMTSKAPRHHFSRCVSFLHLLLYFADGVYDCGYHSCNVRVNTRAVGQFVIIRYSRYEKQSQQVSSQIQVKHA